MKRIAFFSLVLVAAFVALSLLSTDSAHAQRSNTRGIYLNAHLNGTGMGFDDDSFDTQSGGGAGLEFGYGVSPLVTLFLGLNGSIMSNDNVQDAFALAHVDLGTHLNFGRPRSAARPYGVLALTFRQATFELQGNQTVEVDFSGAGITLGGGLKYFLSRLLALDFGLNLTFGSFNDVQVGGVTVQNALDLNATSARVKVGLSWFPSRQR